MEQLAEVSELTPAQGIKQNKMTFETMIMKKVGDSA